MTSAPDESFERAQLTADRFLNRSCIIYGASGTGKTHIIRHLLFVLREHVPAVVVFSLSEKSNKTYSRDMVPRCFVHDFVTGETVRAIADRQTRARMIYERAANLALLGRMLDRVAPRELIATRDALQRAYDDICARGRESGAGDAPSDAIASQFRERMISFYSNALDARLEAQLRATHTLSEDELFALRWFRFNPRITVVFDDCSTELAALKSDADVLEQIFQGRHFYCTTIIALHDTSMVLPAMRMNVGVSIFTDEGLAERWINTRSSGFHREKRDALLRYAHKVISGRAPHTKMLFMNDQAFLITAPPHGSFDAVSGAVRALAMKIEKKNSAEMEPWMRELAM